MNIKPSKRYIKHHFLAVNEIYNQNIHNYGDIDIRNINYNTTPPSLYYNNEEIETMKREIQIAKCPICLQDTWDNESCRVCIPGGHKFHIICPNVNQKNKTIQCPISRCNNIVHCKDNFNDVNT